MSSQIPFFATRDDLLPLLQAIESGEGIRYVQMGRIDAGGGREYLSVINLPNLGFATNESSINSIRYLICRTIDQVVSHEGAGQRAVFDQLLNPGTIEFNPGGLWGENVLLSGRFATASDAPGSLDLMKLARAALRKRFEKVKVFYVGQQAAQMLNGGKRLAGAEQSPRVLDLTRA